MDANEAYREPSSARPSDVPAEPDVTSTKTPPPSGYPQSCWQGVKKGIWGTLRVLFVFALLVFPLTFVPTAIGLGGGQEFALSSAPLVFLKMCLPLVILGVFLGLVGGILSFLIRKVWPRREVSRKETTPEAQTRGRSRRWFWLGLASIPAQVILVGAFGLGFHLARDAERRIDAAVATAEDDDPNWMLDDFFANRVPMPEEENSALVVNEVVSAFPRGWLMPTSAESGGTRSPAENALALYEAITTTPANVLLDDEIAGLVREKLEGYEDVVDLARTVANYKSGQHDLIPTLNPIDMILPESQASRDAVRLLQLDAALRSQEGNIDGALESCCAILGVARSIGDEPTVISLLVRIGAGSIAMTSARRALGMGEPSEEALARLEQAIIDELDEPLMVRAYRGERASMTEVIRRLGTGELEISALSSNDSSANTAPPAGRTVIAPWGRVWFDCQFAIGLEWMNELVEIAKCPIEQRGPRAKAWDTTLSQTKDDRFRLMLATFPLLLMPGLTASLQAESRYKSELGATAIVIAAERQRRNTGEWPKSIEAISKEFLPRIPIDGFTGTPLIYEFHDGQLLVHSVGPNLKDEHGAYTTRYTDTKTSDDIGSGAWDVALRRRPAKAKDDDREEASPDVPGGGDDGISETIKGLD